MEEHSRNTVTVQIRSMQEFLETFGQLATEAAVWRDGAVLGKQYDLVIAHWPHKPALPSGCVRCAPIIVASSLTQTL